MTNIYLSASFITLLFIGVLTVETEHTAYNKNPTHNNYTTSPCPPEVNINREILVNFLTHSEWSPSRQETNTDHLEKSQIHLLASPQSSSTCVELNSQYKETISKTRSTGGKVYNLTYYKVGNFFFTVISLRQPDDPDQVSVGLSFLTIHNENLDTVKGYSF